MGKQGIIFREYPSLQQKLEQYAKLHLELGERKKFLAFLSVDVVDATKMKEGKNEFLVQRIFDKYREFIKEILRRNQRGTDDFAGDGAIASFENIGQAVQAAKDILTALPAFNGDRDCKALELLFRVRCGVHGGEVFLKDEKTELSEIASRVVDVTGHLQKRAVPDTLWVSEEAYNGLEDKTGFQALRKRVDGHRVYEWRPPHKPSKQPEPKVKRPEKGPKAEAVRPLKVLMVISSPVVGHAGHAPVPLDYRKEWQNVVGVLTDNALPVRLVRLHPPTLDNLRDAILKDNYDIVHFIGHASPEAFYLESKYGEEEPAPARELAEVFKDTSVKLVILNACSSAKGKDSPAQAVHAAGVAAVIAASEPLLDRAGTLLAKRLYSGMAAGRTVKDALEEAKTAIAREFGKEQADVLTFLGDEGLAPFQGVALEEFKPEIIDPMPPNNLPFNVAFHGRGEELIDMARLLGDSATRSLIVSGIGGIGKTVLAAEAAYRNRHLFRALIYSSAKDKVNYGIGNLMEDADRVLDLKLGTIADEVQREEVLLRVLNGGPCLLILDNVETVAAKKRDELLLFIGRINPLHGSKVIVAARPGLPEFVEMDGAAPVEVGKLDMESCLRFLLEEARKESLPVRSILSAGNNELESLIKAAGQHPFMIKLAVGRAARESPSDVIDALRKLSGTFEEQVEEWLKGSVELLDGNARSLLRAFTVFAGSADRKAVEAVCGDKLDADSALELLAQASLMEYEPEFMRYSLHQMVIDHVNRHEPLSEQEEEAYRGRAARHYLHIAGSLDSALVGAHAAQASSLFRVELDDMRAGFKWAKSKSDHSLVPDYAYNLSQILSLFGFWTEQCDMFQDAVGSCRTINDRQGEGNALNNLGNAYIRLGHAEKAIDYYQQALKIGREIGDRQGEGNALGNLGNAYADLGEVDKAIDYYQQALKIGREIGDRQGERNALGNLGIAYARLGQAEKAIDYYKQALKIGREIGDRQGEGNGLNNLGIAYYKLDDYEKALACWLAAERILNEIKSPDRNTARICIESLKKELGEEKFNALLERIEANDKSA